MTTPLRFGSEFLVNTTTSNVQDGPTLTALGNGRFVVAWNDFSQTGGDADNFAIRGQVFNADGSKAGGEFLVNTTTANGQFSASIAALDDGRFAVTWVDQSATGADMSGFAVRAQLFNPNGTKSGGEFVVNTTTPNNQLDPAVAGLADGRFVIAWHDASETGDDMDGLAVRAQVFNANGTRSGGEFVVNTTTANDQRQATVTALADGRFIVAWRDDSASGGDMSAAAVRAQIFNPDGTRSGSEFLVNTTTQNDQREPSITALADGRFVATWTDDSRTAGDTSLLAVRGQVFNANGTRSGSEFLVNTETADDQKLPAVTGLADGRFVVAWTDDSQTRGDTSNLAVHAQVFNVDGSRAGVEFLVNTTTLNDQHDPTIAALPDGRFVVAWTDISLTGGDASQEAVRAQIFDPRTAAVALNGSFGDDDLVGTLFADILRGQDGHDRLRGEAGDDVVEGENANDVLHGGSGNDILRGGAGNDQLFGEAGSDQLFGDVGNDRLDGGFGIDRLTGGLGGDTYFVDHAADRVVESGADTDAVIARTHYALSASAPVEILRAVSAAATTAMNLTGSSTANAVTGNNGVNLLRGLAGNDVLQGLGGNDVLTGGLGRDTLNGGLGADRFDFDAVAESPRGGGRDTVVFQRTQGDRIDLSTIDADTDGTAGNQAFRFIGGAAFSGVDGQLRFAGGLLQGDVNGDRLADIEIRIVGALAAGDIIL
jgi:hypothetical protein